MPDKIDNDVLIRAEHISKKFCRSLKRSLMYGVSDVTHAVIPWYKPPGFRNETGEFQVPDLRRDEFWALRDVSFELKRGECLGLIGHNGAGKSTLLKILNSLIRPDSGRITMRGRIGALIELSAGFNPILTGSENIYNQAALLGFSKKETDAKYDAIVEFSELKGFLDMPVQNYSSGMRVRLGFAVNSQLEPDILLVDEVLAVGDIGFRQKCLNKMADLMNRSAVIFVSHSMPQILRVCNEVMLLNQGQCTYYGHDIGSGVEKYFSLFSNQTQTIAGSGEVRLKQITLRSLNEVAGLGETLGISFGDDLTIDVELEADPKIEHVRLRCVIWNMELLPVMEITGTNLSGMEISFTNKDKMSASTTVKELGLKAGKYSISVVVNSLDNRKVYCRQDSTAFLTVNAESVGGAHLLVSSEWLIK